MSNYVQQLKQESKNKQYMIDNAKLSCKEHINKMRVYLQQGEYTVDLETAISYIEKINGELK